MRDRQPSLRDIYPGLLRGGALSAACVIFCFATNSAHAQAPAQVQTGIQPVAPVSSADNTPIGLFTGFWRRPTMLGDMGGLRNVLGNAGITVNLTETSEVLGNVSGGLKQGFTYDGLTTLTLQLDTLKAFGWAGGTFNVSGFQIHGRNLSQYYLGNLQTASGIEASPTTRLWEVWYQQSFLDGRFDVKFGQQSLDQEFMTSTNAALYLNTMMGWPMLPSADLYAGGPAYPLSSLGIRLRGTAGPFTVLGGVFQDNPPGGPFAADSQLLGSTRWGGNFNLRTGALFIAEIQYALNQPSSGDLDTGAQSGGLPGTYKLGAWFDTASYPDQRFDTSGLSLADPDSNGNPKMRRHNYSIYGLADQVVWQSSENPAQSVSVFARAMGAPGDRNLIDFSLNAGINLKAPLPGRNNDTFGIGYGIAHVSQGARGLDVDTAAFSGMPSPIRSNENFIEVTYQYQVTPWWQLQPDFQYVFLPGGGVADPNNPGHRIGNEAIIGLRTNITF